MESRLTHYPHYIAKCLFFASIEEYTSLIHRANNFTCYNRKGNWAIQI